MGYGGGGWVFAVVGLCHKINPRALSTKEEGPMRRDIVRMIYFFFQTTIAFLAAYARWRITGDSLTSVPAVNFFLYVDLTITTV
jgi:hypothetical protein